MASTSATQSYYNSLVERDLFLEEPFKKSTKFKISNIALTDKGKKVEITWNDGTQSRYHSVWLRQNCHCSQCRLSTNQPVVILSEVDIDAPVVEAEKEDKLIRVVWGDDPEHVGIFPLPFLKSSSYSGTALAEKAEQRKMKFNNDGLIPEVNYKEVMTTDLGLYKWLNALGDYGICLVKDVPSRDGEVLKVAGRISAIQPTIYGNIFDVKDKPKPSNFAYTPVRLELHMDQPMYESAPGLQFLHCLRFDKEVTGGESFFVDLFHVAETFREKHPKEFQNLVRIPVNWETIHYHRDTPVHMSFQRPHVCLNHNDEIVGVTWHPGLIGPLQVKEEDVEPYFKAYRLFQTMIRNFPIQYKHRMQAGDLISFNNRRVLHGRESFDPRQGFRHFQGTYVQIDEYKSQLQVYLNKFGDGKLAARVGNMDWT